jgi:hypothetical protein
MRGSRDDVDGRIRYREDIVDGLERAHTGVGYTRRPSRPSRRFVTAT